MPTTPRVTTDTSERLLLAAMILSLAPLASCGRQSNPSPTNTALNQPEGTPERAPATPDPLQPPPLPPQPGHIGK